MSFKFVTVLFLIGSLSGTVAALPTVPSSELRRRQSVFPDRPSPTREAATRASGVSNGNDDLRNPPAAEPSGSSSILSKLANLLGDGSRGGGEIDEGEGSFRDGAAGGGQATPTDDTGSGSDALDSPATAAPTDDAGSSSDNLAADATSTDDDSSADPAPTDDAFSSSTSSNDDDQDQDFGDDAPADSFSSDFIPSDDDDGFDDGSDDSDSLEGRGVDPEFPFTIDGIPTEKAGNDTPDLTETSTIDAAAEESDGDLDAQIKIAEEKLSADPGGVDINSGSDTIATAPFTTTTVGAVQVGQLVDRHLQRRSPSAIYNLFETMFIS